MSNEKYTTRCVVFVIGMILIIVVLVILSPIFLPLIFKGAVEEVSEIIPGFDSFAFITSIVFLVPIAMILIKKKMIKKSD
jgi:hypothetical protein